MLLSRTPHFVFFVGILVSSAIAGNFDHLQFMGFSKDGEHIAFETYGVADGSGFPYAEIHIVDVTKNDFTADRFSDQIKETPDSEAGIEKSLDRVRAQVLKKAKRRLTSLGLPARPMAPLLHHPLTDLGVEPHRAQFALDTVSGLSSDKMEIQLKETLAVAPECASQTTAKPPTIFELSVTNPTTKSVKVLQKDASLPKSRGCTYDYRIQDVYFNRSNSAIAVFLNALRPGFEGPDSYFLVVTGKLK